MKSLRTVLPQAAEILGLTLNQAYERQRVLVKAGVLKGRAGRGPGTGVSATPRNLSLLLISLLVGDLRDNSLSAIKNVAAAKPPPHLPTVYFGRAPLIEVLADIIVNGVPTDHGHLEQVRVVRDSLEVRLYWRTQDEKGERRMVPYVTNTQFELKAFYTEAVLDIGALPKLGRLLKDTVNNSESKS